MTKRKYRKGNKLSLVAAVALIDAKQFIYVRDKVYHPGWSSSWPIRKLICDVNRGWVTEALKND